MNIIITTERNDIGHVQKMIDFTSVTERFNKKGVATKKAKKYLSERLYQTMSKTRTQLDLKTSNESTNSFLTSLSEGFSKKQKDLKEREQKQKDATISFIQREIPSNLKKTILEVLKKEYAYRIENDDKYPTSHFTISEISNQIQEATKITPGELYPIIESLNISDIEIDLLPNPDEPEDKIINIFPIADDDLNYTVASFRPKEYEGIKKRVTKNLMNCLKRKKSKATLTKLRKEIKKDNEQQKSWSTVLKLLIDYFPIYTQIQNQIQKGENLDKVLGEFPVNDVDVYDF